MEKLIQYIPDVEWNWLSLSLNESISIKFIIDNRQYPWVYKVIIPRREEDIDLMLNNLDLPWNWESISRSEFIREHHLEHKILWKDFYALSKNPYISIEKLLELINDEDWIWDKKGVSCNPNLTIEKYLESPWMFYWPYVQKCAGIRLNDIKKWNLEWNYRFLSKNPNITLKYIDCNMDKDWDWSYIVYRSCLPYAHRVFLAEKKGVKIPMRDVNIKKEDKYDVLSDKVSFKEIIKNLDKDWNLDMLSIKKGLKLSDVLNNLDLPWNWNDLSSNVLS